MPEIIKNIAIGVSVEYVNVLMLAAQMESAKARIISKQVANDLCKSLDREPMYDENSFAFGAIELEEIRDELEKLLKGMEAKAEQERKAGEAEPIEGPLAMTPEGVYPEAGMDGQAPKG
jgi:hypothetical protein